MRELVATSHRSDDHLLVRSNPAQFGTEPLYFYIGSTGHVVALCSMPRHCWGMCLICFLPLRFPLRGGKSHRGEVQRFGSGTARAQAGLLYSFSDLVSSDDMKGQLCKERESSERLSTRKDG